jgi:signal transduction histidine kinase
MQKNKSINKEGIGLGLYITRNLAVSLGGTIEVFSEEGVYTKFIVTLPVSRDLNTAF